MPRILHSWLTLTQLWYVWVRVLFFFSPRFSAPLLPTSPLHLSVQGDWDMGVEWDELEALENAIFPEQEPETTRNLLRMFTCDDCGNEWTLGTNQLTEWGFTWS